MPLSPTLVATEASASSDAPQKELNHHPLRLKPTEQIFFISFLLAAGTLALYEPALRNGFVSYDDPTYVTLNHHVLAGLTWANLRWSLTSIVAGHWHPLTMLSYMLGVQLFGSNPAGHHLMSILLHTVNVVLVFLFFWGATARIARSAMIAALFATLPMNVEAVAWIADRKATLSLTFLLAALLAYLVYARRPNLARYSMVLLFFALGLMSEALVVTLPCILLLLDYWPLERFGHRGEPKVEGLFCACTPTRALVEKLAFVPLMIVSAFLAFHAAAVGGGSTSFALFPLTLRIKNAIYSYAIYLRKGIWPTDLAAFYPHPGRSLELWKVLVAGTILLVVTALIARYRQRRYLVVGWLWFLGTMFPVIGISQAGLQGMADRYAYLPFIGLFAASVWLIADTVRGRKGAITGLVVTAILILLAYSWVTHVQIGYWRNSYTLFSHAVQVTPRNGVAEDNLGQIFDSAGKPFLASQHYAAASNYMPTWSTPHFHYARALQEQHQLAGAAREYETALAYENDAGEAEQVLNNLGTIYAQTNRLQEALTTFNSALKIYPQNGLALMNRGIVEYEMHQLGAARADLLRAVFLRPTADAHYWLANVMKDQGDLSDAAAQFQMAARLDPNYAKLSAH